MERRIALVKSAGVASVSAPGTINYSYDLTNTGNTALTGVTLADDNTDAPPVFTGGDADNDLELDLTETWTYTAARTVSQADIDLGAAIVNTATADSGQAGPATDTVTVTVTQTPGIALVKSGSLNLGLDGIATPGDLINYSFPIYMHIHYLYNPSL